MPWHSQTTLYTTFLNLISFGESRYRTRWGLGLATEYHTYGTMCAVVRHICVLLPMPAPYTNSCLT